jgi:hypothetical protein
VISPASISWMPVLVLPNLRLADAIEGGHAALVPSHDARILSLGKQHTVLRKFLARFRDEFGVPREPAIMLLQAQAPESMRHGEAIAGFRDVLALASVPLSRAHAIWRHVGNRLTYSDCFAFYPWMVDRHYEHLVGSTPAMLGLHEVTKFQGQTTPGVPWQEIRSFDWDEELLRQLLAAWSRRFSGRKPSWRDQALFRSLNMAHQACLMPTPALSGSLYDAGRIIALWIASFEILAHPGDRSGVNKKVVMELIEGARWQSSSFRHRRHPVWHQRKKVMRPLPSALYARLYDARNEFLHGNPLTRKILKGGLKDGTLFNVAAPLYRMALDGFLQQNPPPAPEPDLINAVLAHLSEADTVRPYERALFVAHFGKAKAARYRAIRRRRPRPSEGPAVPS